MKFFIFYMVFLNLSCLPAYAQSHDTTSPLSGDTSPQKTEKNAKPEAQEQSTEAKTSLFFTSQELNASNEEHQKTQDPSLKVDGIFVKNKHGQWSIWLNGQCVTHDSPERYAYEEQGVFIEDVRSDSVLFLLKTEPQEKYITLTPSQTYEDGKISRIKAHET